MADNDGDSEKARSRRLIQAAARNYWVKFGPRAGQKVPTNVATGSRPNGRIRMLRTGVPDPQPPFGCQTWLPQSPRRLLHVPTLSTDDERPPLPPDCLCWGRP